MLKAGLWLLLFAAIGCGRKKEAAPSAAETVPADSLPRAVAPRLSAGPPVANVAPAAASIPGNATAEAAAQQMTMELRRYVAYTRTIPKSFEEFVARHPMKYPAPPAGKRYAIEDGRVVIH